VNGIRQNATDVLQGGNLFLKLKPLGNDFRRMPLASVFSGLRGLKLQSNFGLLPLENEVGKAVCKNPGSLRRRAIPVELRLPLRMRVVNVMVSSSTKNFPAPKSKSEICVHNSNADVLSFVGPIQVLKKLPVSVDVYAPLTVDSHCETSPIDVSRHGLIIPPNEEKLNG
jgi:hypothetical protein